MIGTKSGKSRRIIRNTPQSLNTTSAVGSNSASFSRFRRVTSKDGSAR